MTDNMDIDNIDLIDIEDIINDTDMRIDKSEGNKSNEKKSEEKKPEVKLVTKKTLDLYYRHAFPFKLFFKWLGNNDSGIVIFDLLIII